MINDNNVKFQTVNKRAQTRAHTAQQSIRTAQNVQSSNHNKIIIEYIDFDIEFPLVQFLYPFAGILGSMWLFTRFLFSHLFFCPVLVLVGLYLSHTKDCKNICEIEFIRFVSLTSSIPCDNIKWCTHRVYTVHTFRLHFGIKS